jgi:hypothetical protein
MMRWILALAAIGGGCTEYEYAQLDTRDTFVQDNRTVSADVLFVVDDSASMAEEQATLSINFADFIDVISNTDADFQLGVVTTDVDDEDAGKLSTEFITPFTSDMRALALSAVDVGTDGSRDERGFQAAMMALDSTINPGFRREASDLHVVFFSDEDDRTPGDITDMINGISAVAGVRPSLHAVVGDLPEGCASGSSAADPSPRYYEAVHATDGYIESICAPDYASILTRVGLDLAGQTDTFYLTRLPAPDAIEVIVDDVMMPQRAEDGWRYAPSENAIVFHGKAIPRPGMSIEVHYEVLAGTTTVTFQQ